MKKLFLILIMTVILLLFASGSYYEEPSEHTLIERLQTWLDANLLIVVCFTILATLLVFFGICVGIYKGNKGTIKNLDYNLQDNTLSNADIIRVVNKLIELFNEYSKKTDALEAKALKRDAIALQNATSTKSILEILSTVYASNRNIPQSIKDFVTAKYASALRIDIPERPPDAKEE